MNGLTADVRMGVLIEESVMPRPRVLIADDHHIVLESIRTIVAEKCEIVGTASNGHALINMAVKERPDLVVTDISMPSMNGIEVVERLQRALPGSKVIVLTMHADLMYATRAMKAGASGYVLKDCAAAELMTAIEEAMAGRLYVTSQISNILFNRINGTKDSSQIGPAGLSRRHREVLQLLAEGRSAKEIASILHISARTVYSHKVALMKRLELKNTPDLIRFALKHGIIVRD